MSKFSKANFSNYENKSKRKILILQSAKWVHTTKSMSRKLVFSKIYHFKTRNMVMWYQVSNTISLLKYMSTSATLAAARFKSLNYRTTVKILSFDNCIKYQITWELFEIAKRLAKTSQQTSRLHPIQTTSISKIVHVSVLFFKKLAYIRISWYKSITCIHLNELISIDYFLNAFFSHTFQEV